MNKIVPLIKQVILRSFPDVMEVDFEEVGSYLGSSPELPEKERTIKKTPTTNVNGPPKDKNIAKQIASFLSTGLLSPNSLLLSQKNFFLGDIEIAQLQIMEV